MVSIAQPCCWQLARALARECSTHHQSQRALRRANGILECKQELECFLENVVVKSDVYEIGVHKCELGTVVCEYCG